MEDYKLIFSELLKSKDPNVINILVQKIGKLESQANRIKIQVDGLKEHIVRDKIQHDKIVATLNKELVQVTSDHQMYVDAALYGKNLLKIRADGKKKAVK